MKTSCKILISSFFLLYCITSFAQSQTVHTIVLNVNTGEIVKPDIEPFCSFEGQDPNVPDKDFTTKVSVGDIIIWVGRTSSENDVVNITSINYRGGKNILGKNRIGDQDGIVMATVKTGVSGDEEKYTISFKVFNDGRRRNGTFLIDPKLTVH